MQWIELPAEMLLHHTGQSSTTVLHDSLKLTKTDTMFVAPYPNYWHNTATQHDYANHSQTIGYEGAWDPKCPPERWAVHAAMIQTSCMPQTTTSQCQKETPEHTEDLNAEYKDEHQEMQDEWKQEFQHTTEIYCKACQTWLN